MTEERLAIGSRGSALAMIQAQMVADAFERAGHASRIVVVETDGDRHAADTAWGEGAFVAAIEQALLDGRVDVAVHSAKDVPTDEDPRLRIGAFLPRADPRDALVVRVGATAHSLDDLPAGSRVGTDSPRRTGFIRARRPDLDVHPLHGNVDTRLRRLDDGETDALVLACAGLDRLGLGDRIVARLDPSVVPPAPGQGAIAVQIRDDDARLRAITAAIDDRSTRQCVEAERSLLHASGGGCRAPLGALATTSREGLDMLVGVVDPDGSSAAFASGHAVVDEVSDLVAALLADLGHVAPPRSSGLSGPRVLVTRAADQSTELMAALRAVGLAPVAVPTIVIAFADAGGELDTATRDLEAYRWVGVTSANGARAIVAAAERVDARLEAADWAAIGPATRDVLASTGIEVGFLPSDARRSNLAAELPLTAGDRVLVVRGDLAGGGLAADLRDRGALVDDVVAYRTLEAPVGTRVALQAALATGLPEAVIFTSGSTVRGLLALAESSDAGTTDAITSIPAICIGPETESAARAAGFPVLAVATSPDPSALATATAFALRPGRVTAITAPARETR